MKKILYALAFMLVFSSFANATSYAGWDQAQDPALLADSIVIFVPSKDQQLVSGTTELIIEGKIAKVEKGVKPDLIMMPTHSFTGPLQAGVPVRMLLSRFPDRAAYYPIYTVSLSSSEMMTSPPIISINVTASGSKTFAPYIRPSFAYTSDATIALGSPHAYFRPSAYSFDATISFPGAFFGDYPVKSDVYFGIIPPGKDSASTWVAEAGAQSLKSGLTPIAHSIEMSQNSTFSISGILGQSIQYSPKGDEPQGMYSVFALLVVSDTDPSDTLNWIGINMAPLFIREAPTGLIIID